MSDLTYISNTQIKDYASIEDLKVAIIKTLARWFPNHYVFNEHALESWFKTDATNVDILYGNTFQFELSIYGENVYNLVMFAIGRYRRHGSSCDYFERVLDCLEYQLGHPDIEFVTMETARSNKLQGEQPYPETLLWPTRSINESPLPVAGALAETVVYDEAEDAESLEDEDEDSDDEDSDDESSDDESFDDESDDEDERIMSMPLSHMNDTQIEKYVELCGRCPRDECEEWEMVYTGGAILRYSYCKFIQWGIEDQTVSNITISRALFDQITFTNYVFDGVVFEECVFKDIVLNNTTFKNCRFIECEMDSSIVPDDSCRVENYSDSDEDA
jgi:hypothetical protein